MSHTRKTKEKCDAVMPIYAKVPYNLSGKRSHLEVSGRSAAIITPAACVGPLVVQLFLVCQEPILDHVLCIGIHSASATTGHDDQLGQVALCQVLEVIVFVLLVVILVILVLLWPRAHLRPHLQERQPNLIRNTLFTYNIVPSMGISLFLRGNGTITRRELFHFRTNCLTSMTLFLLIAKTD
eukprot:scaffold104545_cov32-Prasinocladus_malaysianus.AAC.1